MEVQQATESGKNLLSVVTVSRCGLGSTDLEVGQPLAPVISGLGNPVATSGNSLTYLLTRSLETPYRLTVGHNDRLIESLEWRVYLD